MFVYERMERYRLFYIFFIILNVFDELKYEDIYLGCTCIIYNNETAIDNRRWIFTWLV